MTFETREGQLVSARAREQAYKDPFHIKDPDPVQPGDFSELSHLERPQI